jgi:hypothetical protein
MTKKEYLGDGVYVAFDGYNIILTTEDGVRVTNTVVLEPPVYAALVRYVEAFRCPASDREKCGDFRQETYWFGVKD